MDVLESKNNLEEMILLAVLFLNVWSVNEKHWSLQIYLKTIKN